jgi:hypothetical protein
LKAAASDIVERCNKLPGKMGAGSSASRGDSIGEVVETQDVANEIVLGMPGSFKR